MDWFSHRFAPSVLRMQQKLTLHCLGHFPCIHGGFEEERQCWAVRVLNRVHSHCEANVSKAGYILGISLTYSSQYDTDVSRAIRAGRHIGS